MNKFDVSEGYILRIAFAAAGSNGASSVEVPGATRAVIVNNGDLLVQGDGSRWIAYRPAGTWSGITQYPAHEVRRG